VGVGFSYTDAKPTENSPAGHAEDTAIDFVIAVRLIYELLADDYFSTSAPLHLAGESYGGRWVPVYAAALLDYNLQASRSAQVPLTSIMIGNAWTSPRHFVPTHYRLACFTTDGIPGFLNETQCTAMESAVDRCEMLYQACYDFTDELVCGPAYDFCQKALIKPAEESLINVYDRTKHCAEPGKCYPAFSDFVRWMNSEEVRTSLEVKHQTGLDMTFDLEAADVMDHFITTGDVAMSSLPALERVLKDGHVHVLYYTGLYDWICNAAGVYNSVVAAAWSGHARFRATAAMPVSWTLEDGSSAGNVRQYRQLTVLDLERGGHLVSDLCSCGQSTRLTHAVLDGSTKIGFIDGQGLAREDSYLPGPRDLV
jgi:cathepsin A (carboxypeptidase C)